MNASIKSNQISERLLDVVPPFKGLDSIQTTEKVMLVKNSDQVHSSIDIVFFRVIIVLSILA